MLDKKICSYIYIGICHAFAFYPVRVSGTELLETFLFLLFPVSQKVFEWGSQKRGLHLTVKIMEEVVEGKCKMSHKI